MNDSQYNEGQRHPENKYSLHESWHSSRSQEQCPTAGPDAESLPNNDEQDLIGRHSTLLEEKEGSPDSVSEPITQDPLDLIGRRRFPGIMLQLDYPPVSEEQLVAEVQSIYKGLVMVETKCTILDAQKACLPHDELSPEQWQALVALHRTLLYEHHDFLMATQHPSANQALLGLATKYSMPARMWKHGIHAFLEVLRHRRPNSQEYMLQFIHLAYQMMTLLLETIPEFTDTWIECLGDLARYRMAIEDDKETHSVWGGVAGRWYVKAADRHPTVGRLIHHCGILQRTSLRKFYLYGLALTSVVPFLNAKASLTTLCSPIVDNEEASHEANTSMEALVICFHARVFLSQSSETVRQAFDAALTMIEKQSEDKFAAYGVPLAFTNIAALLGFGSSNNVYRQLFDSALSQESLESRPSAEDASAFKSSSISTCLEVNKSERPADIVLHFCYQSFNCIIRRKPHKDALPGLLPYVHIMLVFIKSLYTLRSRLYADDNAHDTPDDLLTSDLVDWSALARFLNRVAQSFPISSRTQSLAYGETFPSYGVPLLEDYMIRGLVWAQWYFAPDRFNNIEDDDGSRRLEDDLKTQHRAVRVLYLGMILARDASKLRYESRTKRFSAQRR
jgi:hypothetical protein